MINRNMISNRSTRPSQQGCPTAPRLSSCLVRGVSTYQSPSSQTAASELEIVKRYSEIVVDSVFAGDHKKAATVSFGSLAGIVAAESLGLKPYQVLNDYQKLHLYLSIMVPVQEVLLPVVSKVINSKFYYTNLITECHSHCDEL